MIYNQFFSDPYINVPGGVQKCQAILWTNNRQSTRNRRRTLRKARISLAQGRKQVWCLLDEPRNMRKRPCSLNDQLEIFCRDQTHKKAQASTQSLLTRNHWAQVIARSIASVFTIVVVLCRYAPSNVNLYSRISWRRATRLKHWNLDGPSKLGKILQPPTCEGLKNVDKITWILYWGLSCPFNNWFKTSLHFVKTLI